MTLKSERIGAERYAQPMGMIVETNILGKGVDLGYEGWCLTPKFQRGSVWTLKQKRAWIESILRGVGLPTIFVNRFPLGAAPHPDYGFQDIVIDGQQRLRATADFMQSKFQVRGEYYKDQPRVFKRCFTMHDGLTPVVYCAYETERECAELYLKLLEAGTAHTSDEIQKAKQFIRSAK